MADADGVAIVPRALAADLIARAEAKASTENSARALLLAGGYLREVWEKYRVLWWAFWSEPRLRSSFEESLRLVQALVGDCLLWRVLACELGWRQPTEP